MPGPLVARGLAARGPVVLLPGLLGAPILEEAAQLLMEDVAPPGEVLADALRERHGWSLECHGPTGDTRLHVGAGWPGRSNSTGETCPEVLVLPPRSLLEAGLDKMP